ncbi:MAG: DUF2958 domain-containing protein [Firmicutes bacterium]|nr:DUF2958 domain-containing protein [Bacillota bacterium]
MNLLPAPLKARFTKYPLYSQDGKGLKAKVIAKYFTGRTATWLATEGEPDGDDFIFFGYVTLNGIDWEWGYFSLNEMQEVNRHYGFTVIERELYTDPEDYTVEELIR